MIKVKLDDNIVTFYRTINPPDRGHFGAIDITDINGVDLYEMFKKDLDSGYIKDLILSELENNCTYCPSSK